MGIYSSEAALRYISPVQDSFLEGHSIRIRLAREVELATRRRLVGGRRRC